MKYALLIDSENAQPRMDDIFQELSMYGDTPIRMLVGDFTKPQVTPWLEVCKKHAITCVQTMNFTNGKNSLDISLVIEGMKLLYEKDFIDGIIIVASDSDYTPLAREWRNAGKDVIGIGRKNSTESYRSSCNRFIYVENIYGNKDEASEDLTPTNKLEGVINSVLNDNNGKVLLSIVVSAIKKAYSDFDVRNYGYQKAIDFFKNEFHHVELVKEDQRTYSLQYVSGVKPEVKKDIKGSSKPERKNTKNEEPKKVEKKASAKKLKLDQKTKNTIISSFKARKQAEIKLDEFEKLLNKKRISYKKLGLESISELIALVPQLIIKGDALTLKPKAVKENVVAPVIEITPEVEEIQDEDIEF